MSNRWNLELAIPLHVQKISITHQTQRGYSISLAKFLIRHRENRKTKAKSWLLGRNRFCTAFCDSSSSDRTKRASHALGQARPAVTLHRGHDRCANVFSAIGWCADIFEFMSGMVFVGILAQQLFAQSERVVRQSLQRYVRD
jgi:hypothetical protein